jgi:hypothetical protein
MIWFNVEEAMNQLSEFGEVYTLRDHTKKEGIAMLLSSLCGKPYYKGKVRITFVKKIDMDSQEDLTNLTPYAKKSGFKNQWEWISHVKGNPKFLYLYHVFRIKEVIQQG